MSNVDAGAPNKPRVPNTTPPLPSQNPHQPPNPSLHPLRIHPHHNQRLINQLYHFPIPIPATSQRKKNI